MLCQRSMMRPVGVHLRLPRASASGCTSRHCNVVGRRPHLATAPRSRSAQNRTDEQRASLSTGGAQRQGLWRRASCRGSLICRAGDDAPGPIVSDDGQDSSADSALPQGPSAAVPPPLTDDDSATSNGAAPLRLISGFYAIPHPDKMEKGGEDSHFIGENGLAIGVADGVGGWGELGVDSGLYSKELMINADAKAQEGDVYDDQAPLTILEKAHAKTKAQGSATALVACLGDQRIYAANIGDSGLMMIREGKVMFLTPTQQHDFNFPFQLGSESSASDPPSAAMLFGIDVEVGDVLVAGTDGWLDNVFPEETAAIVARAQERGYDPYRCAELIGGFARARADDKRVITPFAKGAMETGFFWQGGKLDDITVVCAFVVAAER